LSAEQKKLFNLAMPHVEAYANQPLESYEGPTVAGFDPAEGLAQQSYLDAVPGINQLSQASKNAHMMALDPAQLDPNSNPYTSGIADQITGKITDRLNQDILPNVRSGTIQSGGMYSGGDSRGMMAEHLAGTAAVGEMGDALEKLYFDSYNAGLANMSRAVGDTSTVQQQQLYGADVQQAVGGQRRTMDQALMDEALAKWTIDQQLPYMRGSELMNMLGSIPGGTSTTTVTGARPQTSPLMQGLGMGMSLLSMLLGGMI
jgi:hypothetical protein